MSILVGQQYAEPQLQPGYPRNVRDETGAWVREYVYLVALANVYDHIPAPNAVDPTTPAAISTLPLIIKGIDIVENPAGKPGLAELTLRYGTQDQDVGTSHQPGVIITETDGQIEEKPIEEHPQYSSLSEANKKKLKSAFKTFSYGTITYTRTETRDRRQFRISEENAIEGLNATGAPTGMDNATADKWMKFRRRLKKEKASVEITDEWVYNATGWADTITYNTTGQELTAILNKLPEVE